MREFWRTADWLNQRRLRAYPKIFLALYAITIALYLSLSTAMVDPLNRPVGTDFMNVWAAGKMANEGRAAEAYDWDKHRAVQNTALPWHKGVDIPYYGWHYPPMFLMVAALLAMLPYGGALFMWMATTLPLYVATVRRALPTRESIYLALAFPAVFINLGHGQNGFITTALIGGGVMLLNTRPYLAGVLFGLLAYKPQFGILIPVALLMGWHWRAIYAAGMTVVLTALASYKFFGEETWLAFFNSLKLTRGIVLEQGSTGWEKIQSIFSVARMWGGSVELAYAAQAVFALIAATAVAWAWKQKTDIRLQGAALVTASLLATPYILDYDLVALALPVAWLAACGMEKGFRPWEKTLLMVVFLLPLLSRSLGMLYLPPGPFVMMLLLVMSLRRIAYKN